jgi:hypothetical protein
MLKRVVTAGAAGLTVGVIAPSKAEAAVTVTDAVINFARGIGGGVDRLTIRAELEGILAGEFEEYFEIQISVSDHRTGSIHSWSGPPTSVR